MPFNFKQRLKQLRPSHLQDVFHFRKIFLALLVHMAHRRRRHKDSLRKLCRLSSLICHLPRGVLTNEPASGSCTQVAVRPCWRGGEEPQPIGGGRPGMSLLSCRRALLAHGAIGLGQVVRCFHVHLQVATINTIGFS